MFACCMYSVVCHWSVEIGAHGHYGGSWNDVFVVVPAWVVTQCHLHHAPSYWTAVVQQARFTSAEIVLTVMNDLKHFALTVWLV